MCTSSEQRKRTGQGILCEQYRFEVTKPKWYDAMLINHSSQPCTTWKNMLWETLTSNSTHSSVEEVWPVCVITTANDDIYVSLFSTRCIWPGNPSLLCRAELMSRQCSQHRPLGNQAWKFAAKERNIPVIPKTYLTAFTSQAIHCHLVYDRGGGNFLHWNTQENADHSSKPLLQESQRVQVLSTQKPASELAFRFKQTFPDNAPFHIWSPLHIGLSGNGGDGLHQLTAHFPQLIGTVRGQWCQPMDELLSQLGRHHSKLVHLCGQNRRWSRLNHFMPVEQQIWYAPNKKGQDRQHIPCSDKTESRKHIPCFDRLKADSTYPTLTDWKQTAHTLLWQTDSTYPADRLKGHSTYPTLTDWQQTAQTIQAMHTQLVWLTQIFWPPLS